MIQNTVLKPSLVHFSQWNRKGYGLFQVLGKVVKISFLMVAYLLVAEPAEAQKELSKIQTCEETDVALEEVEVKGLRISTSLADLARGVQVITKKEIAKSPYSSIQDLLDHEISLDIRQRGHEGIQADISIQGSTYEQVLVLLNGIPLNNPQTGHFNGDIPVPLQAVERIEVIEGGASRWLGPYAFAGAINIITNTSSKEKFQIKLLGGQHELIDTEATARFSGKYQQLLSVSHKQSSGYSKNTDFQSSKMFYQGVGTLSTSSYHTQVGAGMKKFGANAFYTASYPDQYEEVAHAFASAGWSHSSKYSFSQDVYFRIHADEFHLFRYDAPTWYSGPNQHLSRSYGVVNNLWWKNKLGRITLGIDYKNDGLYSTVLGNELEINSSHFFSPIEYNKYANRQYLSFYGEQVYKTEKILIVAGLMSNAIVSDSTFLKVFPGFDAKYNLGQNSHFFFSANKSMRMPSFTELFYLSPTNQGNPNLEPEEAWSAQTGYKLRAVRYQVNATLFASYGKNLIDWTRTEDDDKWITRNINKLLRTGVEFELSLNPFTSGRWTDSQIRLGYKYMKLSQTAIDLDSRYLLDYLKNKFLLSLEIPLLDNLHFGIQTKIQDRTGWFTDWTSEGEAYQQDFQPFTITDVNIQYRMRRITVFANVLNIFDVKYADIGHVDQSGRWIRIGCKLSILE